MKRRIIVLAFGLFLCFAFANQPILSKEIPNFTTRVLDETNTLEPTTISAIEKISEEIEEKTSAQLIVYVTSSLEGEILEEYSIKVAESNGIGQKSKDNGVLVLIVTKDRKMRIEVGYGLEETLTDIYSNRITQNIFIPNFKKGDYNSGILQGTEAIRDILYGDAESNPNLQAGADDIAPPQEGEMKWNEINETSMIHLVISIGFIFALIIIKALTSHLTQWGKSNYFNIFLILAFIPLVFFFTPKSIIFYPFLIYCGILGYILVTDTEQVPTNKYKHVLTIVSHIVLFSGILFAGASPRTAAIFTLLFLTAFLFLNYPFAKFIEKYYKLTFKKLSFKDPSFKATKGYFFSFMLFLSYITLILLGDDITVLTYIFSLIALAFYVLFWVKSLRRLIYFAFLYGAWVVIFEFYYKTNFPGPDKITDTDALNLIDALQAYSIFHFSLTLIIINRFIESKNNWIRLGKFTLIALSWSLVDLIFYYHIGGRLLFLTLFPVYLASIYILKFFYDILSAESSSSGSYSSSGGYSSSSSSSYSSSSSSYSSSSSSSSSYSSGGGSFGGGGSSGSW